MIVLVHGAMMSSRAWSAFIPSLATYAPGLEVASVDLPGFGNAPETAWRSYGPVSHALAASISARAAGREVVLIGHSMGGGIALQLVADHPQTVAALCVMDSGLAGSRGTASISKITGGSFPDQRMRRSILESWFHDRRGIDWMQLDADAARVTPRTFERMTTAIAAHDLSARRFTPAPLLALRGERDETRTEAEMRVLAAISPYSDYVAIPFAGHCPQIEAPDATAKAVALWLKRVFPQRGEWLGQLLPPGRDHGRLAK